MEFIIVTVAAGLAGFMDAIVGGGGLILVPALFASFPEAHPATLLGNNKSASLWGTIMASWQYSRRVHLQWRPLLIAGAFALIGSLAGAWSVTQISPNFLRKILPIILVGVLIYTLIKKNMGHAHAPRFGNRTQIIAMSLIGFAVGFYDGFFGPGAGSLLVFFLVRWMGYDFLNASAHAKILNMFSNAAALFLFSWQGHVWWHMALPLAIANVGGSFLGSRMALVHGSQFVRWVFIFVVSLLILKTGFDALAHCFF
ncbi:MAG: sulfite exporter TauE/SafE family protein [Limnohabitans sp.]|nr:sulfite exporter TauE/SafE family protein [Limnohabitans sp.]